DFLDHFSLRFGATYIHNAAEFTGRPTTTFIVDDGAPFHVTPQGFSFPRVFQANDDQFYSYLVMSTNGYLDPRLSTYASVIYRQDLSGVIPGSPFQNILYAFDDGTRAQVLNAYAKWTGLGLGILSNTSIRVGRQYVFDMNPDLI